MSNLILDQLNALAGFVGAALVDSDSGMALACMELTEPFEAPVVIPSHATEAGMPKRTSLPSILTGCSIPAATRAGAGWLSAT